MTELKIKNTGSPVEIGTTLCHGGGNITPGVSERDFKSYIRTPGGSYNFDNFLTVIDENYENKLKADKEVLEAKALLEAEKKIRPRIEAEIKKTLDAKYKKHITALEKKISDLNAEILAFSDMPDLTEDQKPVEEPEPEKKEEKKDKPEIEGFVFDPEKHHIEHRGGGHWYVMELEGKVHGPLTEEEKTAFGELLK